MRTCLIDTSALLAMINRRDVHHADMATFLKSNRVTTFMLSELIFVETMVLTKARLSIKPAVEFGNRLQQSKLFEIVASNHQDRQMTWQIFSQYTDKAWSYVDCSLLALARRRGIFEIVAFDHHFDQMVELTRLPK